MSNTVNVGNFSVECFHSPTPVVEGEPVSDYENSYLELIPDAGYVIDANNFSAITPLPDYVSSVTFFQSTQNVNNVICEVQLIPGTVMPTGGIDINLCIAGSSATENYCVEGTVSYSRVANVVPATLNETYSLCGSFKETENVFTQSVSATPGYYFATQPTISLIAGNSDRYTVTSSNVLDVDGNIVNTVFTVNYTFIDQDITGDAWEIEAVAKIIYVPTIEISNYNVSTAAFPSQGGFRYYTIFGDEGANWTLTAVGTNGINNILSIDGSTYVNTLTGVLGANGLQEVLVFVPSSSIPQSFDLTISGDLSSPFIQPITVTIAQLANIIITYATTSPLGYLVTPGSYTKTGFSYASFLAPNRPTTSINWIVDSNDPATVLIKKPNVQYYDYIQNNDFSTIVFTTSGTGFTHPIPPLAAGVDPLLLPSVVGWNFIGETNYGSSIEVTSIDYVLNTITFNTSITVIANQTETIGNNKSNNVQFDLSIQTSGNGVSIFGSAAVNNFGFANNTFLFLVDELVKEVSLPTVVTTGVSNKTGATADSGGETITDGNGTISGRGVQWSSLADFSVIDGTTTDGTGTTNYASTITGLTTGNTYYVRAYVINEAGIAYGQVIQFVSSVSFPTISTASISSISWDSATSGGENISDNGSPITAKGVEWSTSSSFATIEGVTIDGSGVGNFVSNITGLSATTTYYVRAYATNTGGTGYGQTETFQTIALPITGLSWVTTVNNPCNSTPWTITNNNTRIRYDIENSSNCGGSCSDLQSGTATATITVGASDVDMGLDFEGIGELEAPNFEKIEFELDGVQVARAQAAGGSLQCAMGPVVKTFVTPPPYRLNANTSYTFFINFTTNDALFHNGAYYEVDLSFTNVP